MLLCNTGLPRFLEISVVLNFGKYDEPSFPGHHSNLELRIRTTKPVDDISAEEQVELPFVPLKLKTY